MATLVSIGYLLTRVAAAAPATAGGLNISSTPAGAEIFLDGADQALKTPAIITGVPAGNHTVVLRLAGYNDWTGTASVVAGQVAMITAPLTPGTAGYVEASLAPGSCSWPASAVAGQPVNMTFEVNGGTNTEAYHLVFTGAITGNSNSFTVQANTANQPFTVTITFPAVGTSQQITATLVKGAV